MTLSGGNMIRIATAALTKRIFAGKVNKSGTAFTGNKQDVTSDVLKAIIDKIGVGNTKSVIVDGAPKYEITVREVAP
jgi:hypothetical protein